MRPATSVSAGSCYLQVRVPVGQHRFHLIAGFLLAEVASGECFLGLVGSDATEPALGAGQDDARFFVHEQLWEWADAIKSGYGEAIDVTSALSLLLALLKEVPDRDKHTAVTAENYVLSQWPEAKEPPTKPSGQAMTTQVCRNPLNVYKKVVVQ